jgi:thymidylate synthase ThyX
MSFNVRVLADSLAPCGKRLTTMEWTYPRPIHSEIMTHRALSKNSASSRAIPTEKLIQRVLDDPWIPDYIGVNQRGMAPGDELTGSERSEAVSTWIAARDEAVKHARYLLSLGVHKGVVNRLLEPWMWITIIVSATEWPNLFALRLDKMAEPHFQHLARLAKAAMDASVPKVLASGEWHLPLWADNAGQSDDESELDRHIGTLSDVTGLREEIARAFRVKISVGRCARVSYLTHDGRRDLNEDAGLHDRLIVQRPLHASPAEHVAQALDTLEWSGNFCGWRQYRKTLPHENITFWADVPKIS